MQVLSTRGKQAADAMLAVLQGIAQDGGLFVPERFPKLDLAYAVSLSGDYAKLSAYVMGQFFDMSDAQMLELTQRAYATFDAPEVVPVRKLAEREYVMELTHGPTLAFKDMALQVLPRLISKALDVHEQNEDVLILTATSGDTGKAALEGFKDVPRTAIQVFYPVDGVATMQKLQMTTQEGGNVSVCAVKGNFDDAQTGVKQLFADEALRKEVAQCGFTFSSANSINFGRLIPQVAYYVFAYARLVSEGTIAQGEAINFVVPTGNFGNILAGYYAKQMGLPVAKLICASNKNNILTDFFHTGQYDVNRDFHKTMSPSMDILISSNLERLLFEIAGRDASVVCDWMEALKASGKYEIPAQTRTLLEQGFYADFCAEEETCATIRGVFERSAYLMDTHTAVAQCVYEKYVRQTGDQTMSVVVSTANPYKFTQDVLFAVTGEREEDAFVAAQKLSKATGTAIPRQISELDENAVLHDGVVDKSQLAAALEGFLKQMEK